MAHEVLIRHGLFRFHNPETQVIAGEEKEVLVERMAFHNEKVTIPREVDFERGSALGAFWTEEESRAHYDALGLPAPLLSQSTAIPQATAPEGEENEVELTELDEDELVDWLMSTGQFDGEPKPTVAQVSEAMQEGGADFATRLHAAEVRASGEAPRQGVTDALTKVQAAA
jgi:hypothetical protein